MANSSYSKNQILEEAILLLESPNLVWSPDFEAVRNHLWAVLKQEQNSFGTYDATYDLCEALLDGFHNQFEIG